MRRRQGKSQQNDGVIAIADGRIPMIALVQALAVAQYLSFRRAAAALGVSQSSISKHICRLESDLGTLLFDRSTQGTRPTQAGRLFIDQVENAIGILDLAVKTAAMRARGNEGELCIGIHALVAGGFLDRLLERYHRDHPNVLLHITEGTARETQIMVRGDHLDVAFMPDHQDIHDLHSRVFWRDRLMAVVPVGHRLVYSWSCGGARFFNRQAFTQFFSGDRHRLSILYDNNFRIRLDRRLACQFCRTLHGDQ